LLPFLLPNLKEIQRSKFITTSHFKILNGYQVRKSHMQLILKNILSFK